MPEEKLMLERKSAGLVQPGMWMIVKANSPMVSSQRAWWWLTSRCRFNHWRLVLSVWSSNGLSRRYWRKAHREYTTAKSLRQWGGSCVLGW